MPLPSKMLSLRHLLLGVAMVATAAAASGLKPSKRIAEEFPGFSLESAVPTSFGDWRVDPSVSPVAVSPDVQASLDKIYSQVLSRTYINSGGERVMLSVSYGADQGTDDMQVHRPEYCYAAQGFQVAKGVAAEMATDFGQLPIRRLLAINGLRNEPITYWITIGDKATLPGLGRKMAQFEYVLSGKVPDGLLIRVSSIGRDTNAGYRVQDEFVTAMLAAMPPRYRAKFIGLQG